MKRYALLFSLLLVVLVTALFFWRLFTTRIVVEATAKTGEKIFVVQKFLETEIWYNTKIFTLNNDGVWRWYYYDHEDGLWLFGRSRKAEGSLLEVVRNGQVVARWEPSTHLMWRRGREWTEGTVVTNVDAAVRRREGK